MGMRRWQTNAGGSERNARTDPIGQAGIEPSAPSRRGFVAAYRGFTEEVDLATLTLDPDELFGGIRKEAPGRDVRL